MHIPNASQKRAIDEDSEKDRLFWQKKYGKSVSHHLDGYYKEGAENCRTLCNIKSLYDGLSLLPQKQ